MGPEAKSSSRGLWLPSIPMQFGGTELAGSAVPNNPLNKWNVRPGLICLEMKNPRRNDEMMRCYVCTHWVEHPENSMTVRGWGRCYSEDVSRLTEAEDQAGECCEVDFHRDFGCRFWESRKEDKDDD